MLSISEMQEPKNKKLQGLAGQVLLSSLGILLAVSGLEIAFRLLGFAEPPTFVSNPDYGYLMRPNQTASTRGYRFRINRAGLRGSDFAESKSAGVFRVAFLGDSITYGGGAIRDEDLFVNRVASDLRKREGRSVEVINISAPGWGFENMAGYVEHVGLHDSDLVIWVVPSADFWRPKTTAAENNFREQKPRSQLFYALLVGWTKAAKKLESPKNRPNPPLQKATALKRNLEVFDGILSRILRTKRVVVVFIPGSNGYDSSSELSRFQSVAVSRGVAFLDMAPEFHQRKSAELFLDGVHLSRSGHQLVADSISVFLREGHSSPKSEPPQR